MAVHSSRQRKDVAYVIMELYKRLQSSTDWLVGRLGMQGVGGPSRLGCVGLGVCEGRGRHRSMRSLVWVEMAGRRKGQCAGALAGRPIGSCTELLVRQLSSASASSLPCPNSSLQPSSRAVDCGSGGVSTERGVSSCALLSRQ